MAFFFYVHTYFVYLPSRISVFMAGNGSVNNMMRLAYLGKSKGQPFTLSSERLLFHVLYSVINQPNKCSKNLEMCKNCVNTHTHTHTHTHILTV